MIETIEMHPVNSSNVAAVGHDGKDMYVEFHNGGRYRYLDVPQEVFNEVLMADSVGKALNSHIKGTYPFEKLA